MGPDSVVVVPPVVDEALGIVEIPEPVDAQAFVPELAVEAFDEGVFDRLAAPNELQNDAVLVRPDVQGASRELRPVSLTRSQISQLDRTSPRSGLRSGYPASVIRKSVQRTRARSAMSR